MRQPYDSDVFERSVRCNVLCAVISRLVFSAGFANRIRISPAVPPTSAIPAGWQPLDTESAYSHVCHAGVADGLSGCAVCADPPDAAGFDGFSLKPNDDTSQGVQRRG